MRAAVHDRYGPPDVLHVEDVPAPVAMWRRAARWATWSSTSRTQPSAGGPHHVVAIGLPVGDRSGMSRYSFSNVAWSAAWIPMRTSPSAQNQMLGMGL